MTNEIAPDKIDEAKRVQDKQQQLRRDQISEGSLKTLDESIAEVAQNDEQLATALNEICHILTGDDRFDTQQ
jgi:hypothetical protein